MLLALFTVWRNSDSVMRRRVSVMCLQSDSYLKMNATKAFIQISTEQKFFVSIIIWTNADRGAFRKGRRLRELTSQAEHGTMLIKLNMERSHQR